MADDPQTDPIADDSPSVSLPEATIEHVGDDRPPSIAGFRIGAEIGRGAMGIVYQAEELELRRVVAIKVIRPDIGITESRIRMFQREAQTLAGLKHIGVTEIYETGKTRDGRHYLVMEMLRGKTLAGYLQGGRHGDFKAELHRRLRLFLQICDAVAHAHQKGVIHRDLKPTNIHVVDAAAPQSDVSGERDPSIKILDFGLACAADISSSGNTLMTQLGVIQGTLSYMSPQQVRGETDQIDVRTDQYALGVILYEMLTGRRPHGLSGKTLLESIQIISERPPRAMDRTWCGKGRIDQELKTITLKALSKDLTSRYPSVSQLAADVRRYLNQEPIQARPPSIPYQLRKMVARNRVAAAGSLVVVLLLIALGVTGLWGLQATTQAEAEARASRSVNDLLVGILDGFPDRTPESQFVLRMVQGWAQASSDIRPLQEASHLIAFGRVHRRWGELEAAEPYLVRALELRLDLLDDEHPDVGEAHHELGSLYHDQGRLDEAEARLRRAFEIRRADVNHKDAYVTHEELLAVLEAQGRHEEALELRENARVLFGTISGIASRGDGEVSVDELRAYANRLREGGQVEDAWDIEFLIENRYMQHDEPGP